VSESAEPSDVHHPLRYSAGMMVLSKEHPQVIRYRPTEPLLTPEVPQELRGAVADVVFPLASTGATILAHRGASMSIMGWPTAGLGWLAST